MKIRIIIAEPQKMVAEGIRALLENEHNFKILSTTYSGHGLVELVSELKPHLIVMSLDLHELNSIETTNQIIANNPDVKIIALFDSSTKQYLPEMLKAGAVGYILRECSSSELINTIKNCFENHCSICPLSTKSINHNNFSSQNYRNSNSSKALTTRELEVLKELANGPTTKQIAVSLNISVKTVEVHRLNIMRKLKIHTLPELTKFAIREGITSL